MRDPRTLRGAVSSLWVERALIVALVGVAVGAELVGSGAGHSALAVAGVVAVGATLLVRRTHAVAATITRRDHRRRPRPSPTGSFRRRSRTR